MSEGETGKVFESKDVKKIRKSTKFAAIGFGILFIVIGVLGRRPYSAVVGIVLLLLFVLNKRVMVTEAGVETEYDMMVFNHVELWPFQDIREISKELSPDGRQMGLHFMKDVMAKRLVFELDEYDEVIELSREKNPGIVVSTFQK